MKKRRSVENIKCFTRQNACLKQINGKGWSCPEKLLGQDGVQFLVKYGNHYVRNNQLLFNHCDNPVWYEDNYLFQQMHFF